MAAPVVYRARAAVGTAQPVVFAVAMGGDGARAQPVVFGVRSMSGRRARPVVYGVRAQPAGMLIEIGPPGTAYPFDTCQVVGVSRTDGLTPDSWTWRVASVVPPLPAGQSIEFIGSGNRVVYIAPATRTGVAITIEATGHKAGMPDSTDTVVQNITAHGWEWTGPNLSRPVRGPQVDGNVGVGGTLTDVLLDTL